MEKKTITWWQFLCMGLLYIVLVLAASFTGYLNPTCWAYYSVPAALLAAGHRQHWMGDTYMVNTRLVHTGSH